MRKKNIGILLILLICLLIILIKNKISFVHFYNSISSQQITLKLRSRQAQDDKKDLITVNTQQWNASETAIVVVDMWDHHWCKGAERRLRVLALAIDRLLTAARRNNILILHVPSDALGLYQQHPARKRALGFRDYQVGKENNSDVMTLLETERRSRWLIDRIGCPCDPVCRVRQNWMSQHKAIRIDAERDLIVDKSYEIWNIFQRLGIRHIIMVGVHANGCILSRPFGLRNLVRSGYDVVLCRDLTDVMFDPRKDPFTHAEAMTYVVGYIESYICPTILSSDLTDQGPFIFLEDQEPLRKKVY